MKTAEYLAFDATALAGLVARGEATPAELLDAALAQMARVNPAINAVVVSLEEQARRQLAGPGPLERPPNGPLGGVPMLIKDAVQHYAGTPTSVGSRAFALQPAQQHSAIARRLLGAGALIFGKTNSPELALKGVTDPQLFGRSNNPWNLEHTTGGSSGGSAAAVAAGIVPMAGANDGGGSIRIPAACCGLFGLRPSRGRVSTAPQAGEIWEGASSDLVLCRSVRDAALALDILAGHEPSDPIPALPQPQSFRALVQRAPRSLRIGFSTVSPIGSPVHPEAVKAVEQTAALLASLGHEVSEAAPVYDGRELARCYLMLYFGQVAAAMRDGLAAGASNADFELLTRVLGALGEATSAGAYVRSHQRWNDFSLALAEFHRRHDLFLTPTLAHPPIRHGQGDPPHWQQNLLALLLGSGALGLLARLGWLTGTIDQIARDNLMYVPFTQLANLTGTPAMSVPLHWCADGLPLGVQFIGRLGDEATLLQLAAELEAAQPWFDRVPALATAGLG
ncbi:amidase [Rivibacter subsaxonicus]|uniref:Amidase n=1 Tax=Rivibacter subsaxonicus TaxID=457575 RepID=A0A4Q7W2P8_9BURK|nr:amidase [Rivibacter subsaxonicus]RZU02979.1 amidase [Rivibacter subsaxonicus]